MDQMKEIAAYCAANIEDLDIKCGMALSYIGKRMPIPAWFRNEIENCAMEWAEENGYAVDFLEGIDLEELIDEIIWEE